MRRPGSMLFRAGFSVPDADEKYVPDVPANIHNYDFKTFNTLLLTRTLEDVVATLLYLSDREKSFACRALFDQWSKCLAEGWRGLPPHIMEWMARQRFNVHTGDDTPGTCDAVPLARVFNASRIWSAQSLRNKPTSWLVSRPEELLSAENLTKTKKGVRGSLPVGLDRSGRRSQRVSRGGLPDWGGTG